MRIKAYGGSGSKPSAHTQSRTLLACIDIFFSQFLVPFFPEVLSIVRALFLKKIGRSAANPDEILSLFTFQGRMAPRK
jgi:hypothetical protein